MCRVLQDLDGESQKIQRHVGDFERNLMGMLKGQATHNRKRGKDYQPNDAQGLPLYARYLFQPITA